MGATVTRSDEVSTAGESTLQARLERLRQLRARPSEWHKRGLLSPDEIARLVTRRLRSPDVDHDDEDAAGDPTYADFFVGPEQQWRL